MPTQPNQHIKLSDCFTTLLSSWGSDIPPQAIWAAIDFLDYFRPFYKELEGLQFKQLCEDKTGKNNAMIIETLKNMGI